MSTRLSQEAWKPNQTLSATEDLPSNHAEVTAGKLKGSKFLAPGVVEWWVLDVWAPVEDFFVRKKVHPNTITSMGFFLVLVSSIFLATGHLIWGGWILILSGCCDFLDGRVARRTNMQTASGGFFDSVLDRYMDAASLFGLAIYFHHDPFPLCLVYLALLGSFVTPYIRAKAESMGIEAKDGQMQRPERIVYIGVGSFFSGYMMVVSYPFLSPGEEIPPYILIVGLAVVALMSNKTAIERFIKVFQALKKKDASI